MKIKDQIVIRTDFSDSPGSRYKSDGKWSGELFLERLLQPKFEKAVAEKYLLQIDLEKVFGYPSSFVSGSFGKLSLDKGSSIVLKHLRFKSDDNPLRLEKILDEIRNPSRKT